MLLLQPYQWFKKSFLPPPPFKNISHFADFDYYRSDLFREFKYLQQQCSSSEVPNRCKKTGNQLLNWTFGWGILLWVSLEFFISFWILISMFTSTFPFFLYLWMFIRSVNWNISHCRLTFLSIDSHEQVNLMTCIKIF